jgi:hypothetical protein
MSFAGLTLAISDKPDPELDSGLISFPGRSVTPTRCGSELRKGRRSRSGRMN